MIFVFLFLWKVVLMIFVWVVEGLFFVDSCGNIFVCVVGCGELVVGRMYGWR